MHNTESLIKRLYIVLKRRLKARAVTYRDLAQTMNTSEVTIKRWFSQERLSLAQLVDIAAMLGLTMTELMQEAEEPPLHELTIEQETELISDSLLLVITACVFEHWTFEELLEEYDIEESECIKHLLTLDRLRLIDLLPGNKIRLRVARDFAALPNGPLRRYLHGPVMHNFFDAPFNKENDHVRIMHGMLTTEAIAQLQIYSGRFKQLFNELHNESLNAPFKQRHKIVIFLAQREWKSKESIGFTRKK